MVRMNKIIGPAKDVKKKHDTSSPNDNKKDLPASTDADTPLRAWAKKMAPRRQPNDGLESDVNELIIPEIETDNSSIEPDLTQDDVNPKVPIEDVSEEIQLVYQEACQFIEQLMSDTSLLDVSTLADQAQRIVSQLNQGDGLLRLALRPSYTESFLGAHPVNVAILAALVGEGKKFDQKQQLRMVVAALVHDIGMTRLDPEILQNERSLTAKEQKELQQHPNYGAEIILARLGIGYTWLADAVRQEHERAKGQGYPNKLALDNIDPTAQLIGLLDVFEAIIHPRSQHDAVGPGNAVKQVIETHSELFSPQMVKAFVEAISVYPVETYVLLNTGQIGRVISTHRRNPLRPVIEVQTDHNRQRLSSTKEINLQEHPVLSIVKSLNTIEVQKLVSKPDDGIL